MRPHPWLVVVFVAASIGLVFAGLSTYDFVQHLDRQVHDLHCSFIPGMGTHTGESGCQLAMMSPYSSVFRTRAWGGVPIALPAMAVFAFVAFYTVDLLISRRKDDPRATAFLALATALPAVTSIVMLVISLTKLGTTCKLCVGIYVASGLGLVGAIASWRRSVRSSPSREPGKPPTLLVVASNRFLAAMFGIGVAFVAVPIVVYFALAPDHRRFIGTCGALAATASKPDNNVMLRIGPTRHDPSAAQAIEILDPLCPACRAFEQRLDRSGLEPELDRVAVLFPLDNTCNWMVTEATHPGACTVSEAMLCASNAGDGGAEAVLEWAFANQDHIRTTATSDPEAAARLVKAEFPQWASCIGSPAVKARLNKSLRWAVANNLRVMTPQLFVDNVKLCDEDVDLGLEYSLGEMLERHANHTLAATPLETPPPPTTAKPSKPATGGAL